MSNKSQKALDDAWRIYNQEKTKSDNHQMTHLERIAERKAKKNKTQLVYEIKSMRKQEETRTQHRIIKYVLEQNETNGYSYVTTTDEDGTIHEHHKKKHQTRALENNKKYNLAHNTPTAQDPLIKELGLEGLTEKVQQIAEGTSEPPPSIHQDHKD